MLRRPLDNLKLCRVIFIASQAEFHCSSLRSSKLDICQVSSARDFIFIQSKELYKSMASIAPLQAIISTNSALQSSSATVNPSPFLGSKSSSFQRIEKNKKRKSLTVVAAVGDVSSAGNIYLAAGAAAVALIGTAFPILFSRKDLCPVCDGAGFVRKGGATLKVNAARKDQVQIVCANCNGLGKLNQVDKK